MSITKDFYVCPHTGNHVYEHRTVVNGTSLVAQYTVSRSLADRGGAHQLEHITSYLRDSIEHEVGKLLYKGVR